MIILYKYIIIFEPFNHFVIRYCHVDVGCMHMETNNIQMNKKMQIIIYPFMFCHLIMASCVKYSSEYYNIQIRNQFDPIFIKMWFTITPKDLEIRVWYLSATVKELCNWIPLIWVRQWQRVCSRNLDKYANCMCNKSALEFLHLLWVGQYLVHPWQINFFFFFFVNSKLPTFYWILHIAKDTLQSLVKGWKMSYCKAWTCDYFS
jgi:hypothetical protein